MPIFVRLVNVSVSGWTGDVKIKKDTEVINYVLQQLQDRGAHIISVASAVSTGFLSSVGVYTITYEAPSLIE